MQKNIVHVQIQNPQFSICLRQFSCLQFICKTCKIFRHLKFFFFFALRSTFTNYSYSDGSYVVRSELNETYKRRANANKIKSKWDIHIPIHRGVFINWPGRSESDEAINTNKRDSTKKIYKIRYRILNEIKMKYFWLPFIKLYIKRRSLFFCYPAFNNILLYDYYYFID